MAQFEKGYNTFITAQAQLRREICLDNQLDRCAALLGQKIEGNRVCYAFEFTIFCSLSMA